MKVYNLQFVFYFINNMNMHIFLVNIKTSIQDLTKCFSLWPVSLHKLSGLN